LDHEAGTCSRSQNLFLRRRFQTPGKYSFDIEPSLDHSLNIGCGLGYEDICTAQAAESILDRLSDSRLTGVRHEWNSDIVNYVRVKARVGGS
jgi:hypothetical protein